MAARKRDPAAALHSTYQKQLAEINSRREAFEKETAESQAETAHLKRYNAHLERIVRIPDAAGREEYLASQERAVEDQHGALATQEKGISARLLSLQYGVPVAELEGYGDLRDMKIRGLELEREMRLHHSNGTEPED